MGCLLIIGGILVIAYSYGNSYLILLGVILLIWGFFGGKKSDKSTHTDPPPGNGDRDYGGYDGPVHTGNGTPTNVHTSTGKDIDTYGYGWRESYDGGRENIYGERVEKDIYGNWTYVDSDGDTDDRATFDFDD